MRLGVGAQEGPPMIPTQVQRQAAEAERLGQEQAALRAAPEPETPAEPEATSEVSEPTPGPTPAPPVATDPEETWEQRYRSLQGRLSYEKSQHAAQVSDLKTQLAELSSKLDKAVTPPAPQPQPVKTLSDKDVETFGEDLVDLVRRGAHEAVVQAEAPLKEKIGRLEAENDQLKAQLSGVSERQGKSDLDKYMDRLREKVPDFDQVNVDPRFLTWLEAVDPLSGHPRQAYLNTAYQNMDADRTAALFNAWKQTVTPPSAPVAQPATPAKTPEVARQVAPGRSRGTTPPPAANPNEKIWSTAEVEQFYREASQRKYSPDEQARIEAEIDLAVQSGRVRG